MVTIRPVLMGIREVNDWGQSGEQMKESPASLSQNSVHSWGQRAGGGKGDIAFLNGFAIFNLEFPRGTKHQTGAWVEVRLSGGNGSSATPFFFLLLQPTGRQYIT